MPRKRPEKDSGLRASLPNKSPKDGNSPLVLLSFGKDSPLNILRIPQNEVKIYQAGIVQ
jgi:hypothetical protein